MDSLYTYAFMFFMLIMATHRFWSTLFRIKKMKGQIDKGWTLYVLTIVHLSIGVIAVLEYFLRVPHINYLVALIGLIMFTIALIGRTWAENTLGKYHSAQIEIRENQPLIIEGPYKYIRHPIYFFVIIEVLGFPLLANAWYAFFLSLLVYVPLLFIRLILE
jgi:methyltransferase